MRPTSQLPTLPRIFALRRLQPLRSLSPKLSTRSPNAWPPSRIAWNAQRVFSSCRPVSLFAQFPVSRVESRISTLLYRLGQRLDDVTQRLDAAVNSQLRQRQSRISALAATVLHHNPRPNVAHAREHLADFRVRLHRCIERRIESSGAALAALDGHLHSLSPLAVLDRGYALVLSADGSLIRSTGTTFFRRSPYDASRRGLLYQSCRIDQESDSRPQKKRQEANIMSETGVRKLFGTDGIRGVAQGPSAARPLDDLCAVGVALGHSIRKTGSKWPMILLGRDTRESSPWIAATLAEGLRQAGVKTESAGVVPTPAVAFLASTHGFQAGVVISASHNPWKDNGIKLFGSDGYKFPDAAELAMEEEILRHASQARIADPQGLPRVEDNPALQTDYVQFLIDSVPGFELSKLKLVVDCANGAAGIGHRARTFQASLNPKGAAEVTLLNTSPDGRNINLNCGALHPEYVANEVKTRGASMGITFDGDADRCMLAGANGNVINGDAILLMAARDLKARGMLTGNMVVATTMSNMGLEAALRRSGIRMLRAAVGDRYVLEQMQKHNAALGGEQSGHILFPHLATTGDGILTSLVVLDLIARTGQTIDELTADLKVFPQVIVNVKVREKKLSRSIPSPPLLPPSKLPMTS